MRFMTALLSLFISLSCYSVVDDKQIVKSVLAHYPLIEQSLLKVKESEADVVAAEGAFDHKLVAKTRNRIEDKYDNNYFDYYLERQTPYAGLNLIMGHRQGNGHFPAYDGKYKTSGIGELYAGLSMPLLRGLTTDDARAGLKKNQIDVLVSQQQLQLKKLMYVHKALSLYYKAKLEKRKLAIRDEMLKLAVNRQRWLAKKAAAGDSERIALTDIERTINKRTDELLKTQNDLRKLELELSLFVRDNAGNPLFTSIHDDLDKHELSSFIQLPLLEITKLPQYKIVDLEIQKNNVDEKLYRQERYPNLRIEALGARELSPNEAYDQDSIQLGLKFDFPLENRKASGKLQAVNAKRSANEKYLTYLQQEMSTQYAYLKQSTEIGLKRWENLKQETDNAKKMAEAEKSKWEQGDSDLFVVNVREQDLADTEIRKWSAKNELIQNTLDIKLITANLLDAYEGAPN